MPLIGVVTPLLPRPDEIYRGQAIYETVRALRAYADVAVLCPRAVYRSWRSELREWNTPAPLDGLSVTDVPYPAVPLLSRPINGRECARALFPRLEKLRCDITLAYWVYPDGYAAIESSHGIRTPVVVCSRGSDLRRISDPLSRRLIARTLRDADYVLTVSEDLRRRAIDLGAAAERARTILNGCNHNVYRFGDKGTARLRLGLTPHAEIVLYAGRLVRAKGILDLLEAFFSTAAAHPRRELVFIGDGPLSRTIQREAQKHGLGGRVRLLGAQMGGAVAEWMNAADLLCLPSYSEGCPNVVIEAMSSGCPVVATDVGGIPEILRPECGIIIDAHNPRRLAEALDEAIARPWNREAIGRSYSRTWGDAARETYESCREVLRPAGRRRPKLRPGPPIKVTVVTPYFPRSGNSYAGHSAIHTLRQLADYADVTVIAPGPATRLRRSAAAEPGFQPEGLPTTYLEYPVVPLLTRPLNGLSCYRKVLPLLRRERPDIVLNYWLYPEGLAAVRAAHRLGIPAIVGSIGSDLRRIPDPVTRAFVRKTIEEADGVITVSEDLRRIAIDMGAAADQVTAILNGCDTSVFYPDRRNAARQRVGTSPEDEVILYVGSLLQSKGLAELVAAFGSLLASRPKARLVCIGEGRFREKVVRAATAAGAQGRVSMLGFQPSTVVAEWMRAADVFCLPSYSEGCPNVVVEALACGRAVVATEVGGIPELVNGESGILVPPRDVAALRGALETALSRPWDSPAIASRFRRDWDAVAQETLGACVKVLERAAPKRLAAGFLETRAQ